MRLKETDLSRLAEYRYRISKTRGESLARCSDLLPLLPVPCGDITQLYCRQRGSSCSFTELDVASKAEYSCVWSDMLTERGNDV